MHPADQADRTSTGADAPADERPVVFYDGGCGLCARSVRILLALDRDRALRFASLSGDTAARLLPPELAGPDARTLVLWEPATGEEPRPRLSIRSTAVLRALGLVARPPLRAAAHLARLPPATFLLDLVYRAVAAVRRGLPPPTAAACALLRRDERHLP
jgi:predicted DCC family thiol-disulfide oxidoreductase YuxK